MNEADIKIKKQIVDKIKSATNILIAVSQDPSVDDLSAAIGLAAILNKLDKHATAIFSGTVPSAINFLEPDKVFENSVDSLRDFIISLDKEKADHLRYKVEGDVVKIFITPYRTTISGDDLEFSQGDYNVELVLALGVSNQEHLDTALSAHGQIIHDVTVASLSANDQSSQLGSIEWHDSQASGMCEMIAAIGESLKSDKALLDKQIATALLTGIVASTDRFSNTRTSANVMTVAAQLMAAGADQQLIAARLQESHEINSLPTQSRNEDVSLDKDDSVDTSTDTIVDSGEQSTLPPDDGSLSIEHEIDTAEQVSDEAEQIAEDNSASTLPAEESSTVISTLPDDHPPITVDTIPPPQPESTPYNIDTTTPEVAPAYSFEPTKPPESIAIGHETVIEPLEPLLGGTLNATTDEAAEQAKKELDEQQNKMILEHSYLSGTQTAAPIDNNPLNGIGQPEPTDDVDIFSNGSIAPTPGMPGIPDLPPPPPAPDFSTLPPPPLPDFGAIPPVDPNLNIPPAAPSNDPGQFRIPGQ